MAESTIVMSKQANKLDGSLNSPSFPNSPPMTRCPACISRRWKTAATAE